jgi:hypothetical protein
LNGSAPSISSYLGLGACLSIGTSFLTWRFNNRKNPFLFRDTMLKLIASDNLEYKELTKGA